MIKSYKDITISNHDDALADYQVLVNLTDASFPVSVRTDGADLRFTDAGGAGTMANGAHIWFN